MNKIYLVDIDGTICDDIRNEDSHLFATANHFEESRLILNKSTLKLGKFQKTENNKPVEAKRATRNSKKT